MSWAAHILRSLIVWLIVFGTLYVQNIKLGKKLLIATIVLALFLVNEYLLMPLYVPDFCHIACSPKRSSDTSVDAAIAKLRLDDVAGPAVRPDYERPAFEGPSSRTPLPPPVATSVRAPQPTA